MDKLLDRLNSDPMLRRHGAYYSTQISIVAGAENHSFDINLGQVEKLLEVPAASGFSLVGAADAWRKFCEPVPPPEHHELGALLGSGHVRIEGDMYAMQSNFMYVRRLLELWREDQRETRS